MVNVGAFKEVNKNRYRNYSSLDNKIPVNTNVKKMSNLYLRNSASSVFNSNVEIAGESKIPKSGKNEHSEAFSPLVKHKRNIYNIERTNPEIKKETLNLKKLYEGNSSYAGNGPTVSWNINTSSSESNNSTSKINSESKNKFLKDVLGRNPMKQVTFDEKLTNDKDKRARNYNKFLSVSDFLGSNQLKKNLSYADAGSRFDDKTIKVTNSHYDSNQAQRLNSSERKGLMKFQHMYDNGKGYYL